MIIADNPHNCKRGGVSIYFKEHLAVRPVSLLNLDGCLVLEINIANEKGFVIFLYRSPNQSKDEFLLNSEQLIPDRMSQNPHFILVTLMFARLLGGKMTQQRGKVTKSMLCFVLWLKSTNLWIYTYFTKFVLVHWSNFYQSKQFHHG